MELNKEILQNLYWNQKLSTKRVAKILEICQTSVINNLKKFNITRRSTTVKNTKLTEKFLKKEYLINKMSTTDIGKEVNAVSSTISLWLRKYNIPTRRFSGETCRKYKEPNLSCLKKLTAGGAYFLGFFAADGHFSHRDRKGQQIIFGIHHKDKPILEKFKKLLNIDNRILTKPARINFIIIDNKKQKIYKSKSNVLSIASMEIKNILKKYDLDNKKSERYRLSPSIPKKYIKHFIRGFFAGDGCISEFKPRNPKVVFTSANNRFLLDIGNFFINNYKIYNWLYKSKNNNDFNLHLKINQKNLKLFYNILYKNAKIYLTIKKRRMEKILKSIGEL